MKHSRFLLATLALATVMASAQMNPGGMPSGGAGQQQQPGGGHLPGMGEPGMGRDNQTGIPSDSTTDQQQQQRTNTPKVDDATLERMVHEQLARKPELIDVKASVQDGVVQLEGSVPSKQDRKEAKKLVQDIPGVRKVKENLTIRSGGPSASASPNSVGIGTQTPDTAQNAEQQNNTAGSLAGNTAAASGTASGSTAMGQSGTSTSSAPSMNPSTAPTSAANSTLPQGDAASATSNSSQDAVNGPDAQALEGQIRTALQNDPNTANGNITVSVSADAIDLSGTVANGKAKENARRIAQSYAGSRKVNDRLAVSGRESGSSAVSTSGSGGNAGAASGINSSATGNPSSGTQGTVGSETGTTAGSATGTGNSTKGQPTPPPQ